jgi:hypothetical protein
MKNLSRTLVVLLFSSFLFSCVNENSKVIPKENKEAVQIRTVESLPSDLIHFDTTYVPIYSDIYTQTTNVQINLTATLSLRNTSFKHSLYISEVDYYNSAGELDQNFAEQPIELKPMQSMEYVIEEEDISGGTGANFIIIWAAKSKQVTPLFEAVMISTQNRQGISFTSRGISISHWEEEQAETVTEVQPEKAD